MPASGRDRIHMVQHNKLTIRKCDTNRPEYAPPLSNDSTTDIKRTLDEMRLLYIKLEIVQHANASGYSKTCKIKLICEWERAGGN